MSNCGGCGGSSSSSGCSCIFIGNDTANLTGNGRSYAGFNYRPTNVPLPRPYGKLTRIDSDQVISASSTTAVVFDHEFSTFEGGMTNVAAQPTRLTAPVDGYYLAVGYITSNWIDDRLFIAKNGGTRLEGQTGAAAGDRTTMTLIDMVANDYLELFVAADSGVTIIRTDFLPIALTTACYPHFWAEWVRPL